MEFELFLDFPQKNYLFLGNFCKCPKKGREEGQSVGEEGEERIILN